MPTLDRTGKILSARIRKGEMIYEVEHHRRGQDPKDRTRSWLRASQLTRKQAHLCAFWAVANRSPKNRVYARALPEPTAVLEVEGVELLETGPQTIAEAVFFSGTWAAVPPKQSAPDVLPSALWLSPLMLGISPHDVERRYAVVEESLGSLGALRGAKAKDVFLKMKKGRRELQEEEGKEGDEEEGKRGGEEEEKVPVCCVCMTERQELIMSCGCRESNTCTSCMIGWATAAGGRGPMCTICRSPVVPINLAWGALVEEDQKACKAAARKKNRQKKRKTPEGRKLDKERKKRRKEERRAENAKATGEESGLVGGKGDVGGGDGEGDWDGTGEESEWEGIGGADY
ncbi:hypothetical protein D9611_015119 [Ephemerocybe angulata]|uniref:RING-type domain-containing protein n=1 Tax=Ephemerocybe angulata TaxID=980116 RepID=A0A8H5C9Z7_9AGAR|nr:hypothetical protein D9611_015119 [Tulosesus angulatus]